MRKILGWYKFHLLRSFEFDRAWPWQKVYWTEMGKDERDYEKQHGLTWPWQKLFWSSPRMKRFYSILLVIIGYHAFFIGLIILVVLVDLLVRAIAG